MILLAYNTPMKLRKMEPIFIIQINQIIKQKNMYNILNQPSNNTAINTRLFLTNIYIDRKWLA